MRRISVLGIAAMLSRTSWSIKATERLARLMRVTRLVSVFPELRLIIGTMLRSIPSMGHVIMLLSLLLYVYAVLGFYLFRDADAEHWGTLGAALLTLFQMLTLEGWVEVQDGVLSAMPWAWLYFGSFIFVGVFVVVNLFGARRGRFVSRSPSRGPGQVGAGGQRQRVRREKRPRLLSPW